MALNISAAAIRNPIPVAVLFLALLFAGATAYFRLPINQVPNIEFPRLSVTVIQPGASPAELETQIAQKIEASLTGVDGVKRVDTTITPSTVTTLVELNLGVDLTQAVDEARDAVSRVRQDLPADINEPIVARENAAEEPIAYYALNGEGMSPVELSWFIDDTLTRELLAVDGVSQVRRLGGVDREIRIELDPLRLKSFGVTADEISRQLRAVNVDLPGGRAALGGQAQSIRTLGGALTVEELADTRISLADGRSMRLRDLGEVTDGASELDAIARYNGAPAISFLVQRSKGSSEVDVFHAMEQRLEQVSQAHPGVTFQLLGSPVDFVEGMHESSIHALVEGALLAVLVVFLILRDWRATVIAAFAIPLAVIPTFAVIEVLGFTLNMMTLIALGLVAGVLVDDAIVEIENIVRHMRMGKKPFEAAMEAADEIGLAVVATSATIIAVFIPVGFMSGTTGQFFREFGFTVAIAVFFSLIVARLVTPLMAAYFMKPHTEDDKPGKLTERYEKALRWSVRRPAIATSMGIGVFAVSMWIGGMVPFTFLPRLDNGSIQARVEFPPGTPLELADRKMRDMRDAIAQTSELDGVFTSVGGADGAASEGSLYLILKDREDRDKSAYEVEQALRPLVASVPDVRVSFLQFQGGGRGSDVMLEFVGDDPIAVEAAAEKLVAEMRAERGENGAPIFVDTKSSASLKRPEIQIRPIPDEAARLGVSAADLAAAVRIATGGDVDQNLAKFDLPDRQVPIRVLLRPDTRQELETIKALDVRSSLGGSVRLDSVADVSFGLGEATIERRDRRRKVTVSANVIGIQPGDALAIAMALPAAVDPPETVRLLASGNSEENADLVSNFMTAMIWGVLLIYGVLVLLFRDFFQPITIMFALPLSFGGAFLALLATGQPLSLFVFVGLLMLMGIVTKNSILLVDFAIERMREGVPRNDALIEAGKKRARPIIMTTIAMSAGMIPAAAGWGVDGALRQGMGVAVIGGLILSTMLSLLFVPSVFVLIDRLEKTVLPFFARFTTKDENDRHAETALPATAAEQRRGEAA
jgi:HAE1 family hydrophobic/amphiphilic exporter-1